MTSTKTTIALFFSFHFVNTFRRDNEANAQELYSLPDKILSDVSKEFVFHPSSRGLVSRDKGASKEHIH